MEDLKANGETSLKRQATDTTEKALASTADGHEHSNAAKKLKNIGILDSPEVSNSTQEILQLQDTEGNDVSPVMTFNSTSTFIPSEETAREIQDIWDQLKILHGYDPDACGLSLDEENSTSSCEQEKLSQEEILKVLKQETDDDWIEVEESDRSTTSNSSIEPEVEILSNNGPDPIPANFIIIDCGPITRMDHSTNVNIGEADCGSKTCEDVSDDGKAEEIKKDANVVSLPSNGPCGQSSSNCGTEQMIVQIKTAGLSGKVAKTLTEDPILMNRVGEQLKEVCRSFLRSKETTNKDCTHEAKDDQSLKCSETIIDSDTEMETQDEIEPAENTNDKVDVSVSEVALEVDANTDLADEKRLRPLPARGIRFMGINHQLKGYTLWKLVKRMREEMSKDSPNLSSLSIWMARSFECRKNALVSHKFELCRFLKKYPAMTNYQMVKEEYGRIRNDVSKMSKLENDLIADFRLVLAMRIRYSWNEHPAAAEARGLWRDNHDSELEKIYGMVCLAAHIGRDREFEDIIYLRTDNEEVNPQTMINPTLDVRKSQLFERNTEMWIYMDTIKYLKVPNVYEGILCIHAIYWIFNLRYHNQRKIFLDYLDAKAGNPQSTFRGNVSKLLL